jgi:hypothetical protein
MAKTYLVGDVNQVKRINNHVYPGTTLTPIGDADTTWRDVMTHPVDEDRVIIVGSCQVDAVNHSIQISVDAGTTWITPGGDWSTVADYFYEVFWCENATDIVAVSASGHVAVSTDGGATFNLLPQIAAGAYFQTAAIHALDASTIVVSGSAGEVITQSENFVWKWDGVSWTTLNGGLTLLHPGAVLGTDPGNANGIWISPDEQKIIVATGYMNSVSLDGGATFDADNDPENAYMNRSGAHLTWYPTYDAVPQAFRHTGGIPFQITESTDGGIVWNSTRWFNNSALPILTNPLGNQAVFIRAAHFYTLLDGYYSDKNFLYKTSDGGLTESGVAESFTNGTVVNAVWTGETKLENNPDLYTLIDCCDTTNIFRDPEGNIVVLEDSGDYTTAIDPALILDKTITFFEPGADSGLYSATGCWTLTLIEDYPVDPYTASSYEPELNATTIETVDACSDCCTVFPCFLLTDCAGVADPIYTGTDLTEHLGQVITLADTSGEELEGCWLVEISDQECVDVPDVTVYKCHATCEDCLPPEPPIRTPKLRKVLPNYTTGNCDPAIVEKAFCEHADLMHKEVMSKRFMIDNCCPKDEDKILMQKEKIRLKLLESIDPTPDECNPVCMAYEGLIQPGYSAVTTYTDCFEVEQVDTLDISTETQLISVCALNTNPPITVISDEEGNEVDTFVLVPVEECDPTPAPVYHNYIITVQGGYNFSEQFFTLTTKDELGNPVSQQIDLFFGKSDVSYNVCAQHGTLLFNGTDSLFISGDIPECGDCPSIAGIIIQYLGDC